MADPLAQLSQLGSEARPVIAACHIAVGAVCCFHGYRIFRLVLGLLGLLIGGGLAVSAAGSFVHSTWVVAAAGLLGARLGSYRTVRSFRLGLFILGGVAGVLGGGVCAMALNIHGSDAMLLTAAAGLVGGVLTVLFNKLMIIICTSFSGAWGVAVGATYFVLGISPELLARNPALLTGTKLLCFVGGWLVLGALGFRHQYWGRRRRAAAASQAA